MCKQRATSGKGGRCCRGCDKVSRPIPPVMAMDCKEEPPEDLFFFLLFAYGIPLRKLDRFVEEMQYLTPHHDDPRRITKRWLIAVVEAEGETPLLPNRPSLGPDQSVKAERTCDLVPFPARARLLGTKPVEFLGRV